MTRPQGSELRSSGATAAFHPVPEDNLPGHRPERDQDQPELDAFAARFSGRDLDDLPTETGLLDDTDRASADGRTALSQLLRRWAPIAGFATLAAVVALWVRRRR